MVQKYKKNHADEFLSLFSYFYLLDPDAHIECGSGSRREKMLSLMEPEGLGVKTVVATLQTKLKNYIFVFKCVLESWTINQATRHPAHHQVTTFTNRC